MTKGKQASRHSDTRSVTTLQYTHARGTQGGGCSLVSTRMHGLPTTRHLMLADSNPVAGWMVSG